MNVRCMYSIALNRLRCARIDLHIAPSNGLQDGSCIECGLVKRGVAMDRGHTEKLDSRVLCAEEQSICILGIVRQ